MPKAKEKPATLGCEIPGSKGWNLILSQEGRKGRIWNESEVRDALKCGFACERDGELHWNPRYRKDEKGRWKTWKGNPSSTVWRKIDRQSLGDGVTINIKMFSRMDRTLPKVDYTDKWGPDEISHNLRNVAGTGDFRVGLLQTDGSEKPGEWQGFQVRLYPYLHKDAKKYIGENDRSNCSYWYRSEPGGDECLMDDYSQMGDRDGFKKLKHKGQLKFGMGPHAPFDEWVDIQIKLRETDGKIHSTVKVHDDEIELEPYQHKTSGFGTGFTNIDAVCLSFNNMRPYCDLKIFM